MGCLGCVPQLRTLSLRRQYQITFVVARYDVVTVESPGCYENLSNLEENGMRKSLKTKPLDQRNTSDFRPAFSLSLSDHHHSFAIGFRNRRLPFKGEGDADITSTAVRWITSHPENNGTNAFF